MNSEAHSHSPQRVALITFDHSLHVPILNGCVAMQQTCSPEAVSALVGKGPSVMIMSDLMGCL